MAVLFSLVRLTSWSDTGRVPTFFGCSRSCSDDRKPPANRLPVSFGTMIECGRPSSENDSRAVSENGCYWSAVSADLTEYNFDSGVELAMTVFIFNSVAV